MSLVAHRSKLALAALLPLLFALFAFMATPSRAETGSPPGVVNINQASAEQLMLLPRVGEEKARRIIEHRQKSPFKTVNELGRVKGFGLKTLRMLKPFIRVDGPTTLAAELRPEDAELEASRGEPARPATPTPPRGK